MTTSEALNIILLKQEYGQCRAYCVDDYKFQVYELTGHYPGATEFKKAFEDFRTPINKHGLVYCPNVGWYKVKGEAGKNAYKKRLQNQIDYRTELKQAIR